MKVEVAVLGRSRSLIVLVVSVDTELEPLVSLSSGAVWKVEVDVLGSPSQIVLPLSVDLRQH